MNNSPILSMHFLSRQPSAIRRAQMQFAKRNDGVTAINTAIGNVSLPMHPAMQERMFNLNAKASPFANGIVRYSETVGMDEANQAFLNVVSASGFSTQGLFSQITDGGSQAMELVILGTAGEAGTNKKPLLLLDAAYANYNSMAQRLGRTTISVARKLQDNGLFSIPNIDIIEQQIIEQQPGALLVIPYDNPTGQFIDLPTMGQLGKLCVKHNLWLISDEAYRELHYTNKPTSSIWGISNNEVPGIHGRRISIESTSKVWNACGLRIGAIITDSEEFHTKSVAENTANLCSSVIGQYIFGAIAQENKDSLQAWFRQQRNYYRNMLDKLTSNLKQLLPDIIVSYPETSIYSVVDVRNIVDEKFNAADFVDFCANHGKVDINNIDYTLLVSPMAGFYTVQPGQPNPGKTQMRIAYVETPEKMEIVPELFSSLLKQYLQFTA